MAGISAPKITRFGIAGRIIAELQHISNPTLLNPLGRLADNLGKVLNVKDFALESTIPDEVKPLVLLVMGTAMNSGKTTVAASLTTGLVSAGLKVGAAKATGTGSGPDAWMMKDSGADSVLDIVDAGLASSYKQPIERIASAIELLRNHLVKSGPDVILLELADGLYHEENQGLLGIDTSTPGASRNYLATLTDGVIFAASDSIGARTGVDILRHAGMPVLALAGVLSRSPLAVREVKENIGLPVLRSDNLSAPDVLTGIKLRSLMKWEAPVTSVAVSTIFSHQRFLAHKPCLSAAFRIGLVNVIRPSRLIDLGPPFAYALLLLMFDDQYRFVYSIY